MKAKGEPLDLTVVHADEAVDAEDFLRLYLGAVLAEVRRDEAASNEVRAEVPAHEAPDIEQERPRLGFLRVV